MTKPPAHSPDQARGFLRIAQLLNDPNSEGVYAVMGKAGSGKTRLLSDCVKFAQDEKFQIIHPEFETSAAENARSIAILTPTNKASSVLRRLDVPATTLHRILYTPVYDKEFEDIAEWLQKSGKIPESEKFDSTLLNRAKAFYEETQSLPGAMAIMGAKGADFITGWKRRDEELDIALIDEASMLDDQQMADLQEIFSLLILFGDPAQLAPVGASSGMVFDKIPDDNRIMLNRIHRQKAKNPILDLAHLLGEPDLQFSEFERAMRSAAQSDERVQIRPKIHTDIMPHSPVLVWRNATRKRLIAGFRRAFEIEERHLQSGEPLICDSIELPAKHRKNRLMLESRGLIKGAQVNYIGPGKKLGFSKVYIHGVDDPWISVASIIQIETPDNEEPLILSAARMGVNFIHGAATTIHKAQGSQWEIVQVFAPDIAAAARMGRVEAGIALWKRLAYVALTRASEKIYWITDYRMEKPSAPLEFRLENHKEKSAIQLEAEDFT